MIRVLIFIKHNLVFIWKWIEFANSSIFYLLYHVKLESVLSGVFREIPQTQYSSRKLLMQDIEPLYKLIHSQEISDLKYFSPHGFDINSLQKQMKNKSFLMMGVFDKNILVGYFFLRFFINRKCFVGRLIDKDYRGKGIGSIMNTIMYETAWRLKFRCLSTISRDNKAVVKAHSRNSSVKILKELQNNYLLIEFIRSSGN